MWGKGAEWSSFCSYIKAVFAILIVINFMHVCVSHGAQYLFLLRFSSIYGYVYWQTAFGCADKILSKMGEGLGFLQSVVSSSAGYLRYYSNEEDCELDFRRYFWACFGMLGPWNTWICCHKSCSQYPQVPWCCNDWDRCAQSPCRKWEIQISVSISKTLLLKV